jgi:4-diphosphocytidyl-2-C-methyl-D-erythritol kinase
LHVLGRRADGYHELDSIVTFCDVVDTLTFTSASHYALTIGGPFAGSVSGGEDNLVLKAARRFAARYPEAQPYRIALEKNLPVAAGLGGGSADAAATLRGLARLTGRSDGLHALAGALGSDVPVCLAQQACRMRGRGEQLEPLRNFGERPAVLVNPGIPLPTADVFRLLALAPGDLAFGALAEPFDLARSRNDLTAPALRLVPAIADVLAALTAKGATLARMSGSGPTCFGLFGSHRAARNAAISLAEYHPDWWVRATTIG